MKMKDKGCINGSMKIKDRGSINGSMTMKDKGVYLWVNEDEGQREY